MQDNENIEEYIEKNEHIYKDIIRQRNVDKDIIESALEHVRKFIIKNELVIYGGLAIDYALRLKGDSIYHEDDIPDYDCISDYNVDLAYDLGELLYSLGFENVKVIKAIHTITMRVRVNLITVLDLTYFPTKYFRQCKTINYKGLRVVHPDVQRLDMHKAFCFPFNNPPMEDIFHRWKKDIIRFNKFEKLYPVLKSNDIDYKTKLYTFKLPDSNTSKKYAFHSFAAYALYYKELSKYINLSGLKRLDISFTGSGCTLEMPMEANLCLVSSKDIHKAEYASMLDRIPESLVVNKNVSIYLTNQIAIVEINKMQVVTIQYILMHFLFFYNFYDDDNIKLLYKNFYVDTLKMIELAEEEDIVLSKLVWPSIKCLGSEPLYTPNIDQTNMPVNYTPSKENTRQQFDYSNFKISGEKL